MSAHSASSLALSWVLRLSRCGSVVSPTVSDIVAPERNNLLIPAPHTGSVHSLAEGDVIMAVSGNSLTRVELSDAVYRSVGLSRAESKSFVELFLKEITDCIARGETVKLPSFGTFTVRKKGQRMGRNPKTGIDAKIPPRRAVVFKASAIMKERINGNRRRSSQSSNAEAHIE
jgi:integration host factor subunit alpha